MKKAAHPTETYRDKTPLQNVNTISKSLQNFN